LYLYLLLLTRHSGTQVICEEEIFKKCWRFSKTSTSPYVLHNIPTRTLLYSIRVITFDCARAAAGNVKLTTFVYPSPCLYLFIKYVLSGDQRKGNIVIYYCNKRTHIVGIPTRCGGGDRRYIYITFELNRIRADVIVAMCFQHKIIDHCIMNL